MRQLDLSGQRIGRLVVLKNSGKNKWGNLVWLCVCDCGQTTKVRSGHLRSKSINSCGCLQREVRNKNLPDHTTHGMSKSREYLTWKGMIDRCYNSNNRKFKYYGGRGITVCDRWLNSFENFYEDMGDKPAGLTIERVNNNEGYSPDNCVWADYYTQNNNRRNCGNRSRK